MHINYQINTDLRFAQSGVDSILQVCHMAIMSCGGTGWNKGVKSMACMPKVIHRKIVLAYSMSHHSLHASGNGIHPLPFAFKV